MSTPTQQRRLDDPQVWDVLASLAVGALVLWGWQPTFTGALWWIDGTVAVLLAVMLAVVGRDNGWSPEVVITLLLVLYVVVAGPLASGSLAFRGWDTFTDGLRGTVEVWGRIFTTHPPLDSSGPPLLAPVFTGLMIAGVSAVVALATDRPAAPLVPAGLGLGLVVLLGQVESGSVLVMGAGTSVVLIMWLRARSGRRDLTRFGVDPARRRRGIAALLVLAAATAAAMAIIEGVPEQRLVLREAARPFAVSGLGTPLDDYRTFTPQRPDLGSAAAEDNVHGRRLLEVEGLAPGTRLRFAALDKYDETSWHADNDTVPGRSDDRFLHVSSQIDNPSAGERAKVTVRSTKHWDRVWVPTTGAVQGFEFLEPDPDLRDDLRYNPATQTAVLPDGLERGTSYSFETRVAEREATPQMKEWPEFDRDLYDRLAILDQVIAFWKRDAITPMDAVFKVAAGLREIGTYSNGTEPWEAIFPPGQNLDRLTEDFLLSTPTVGDEEQYAAAMALLAVRMRVPARVVVGAMLPRDGVVRGDDVTAWVELRAADGAWRTLPTETFTSGEPAVRQGGPPVSRDYNPPGEKQQPRQRDDAQTDDEQRDDNDGDASSTHWRRWLWLLAALPLVAVVALPVAKAIRRRRRLNAAAMSTRYAGAWAELVDHARDLGLSVPGGTRPAQADELGRGQALALEADRRIYSADPLSAEEAQAFWQSVRGDIQALDSERSRPRRWWARFNPRSLGRSLDRS